MEIEDKKGLKGIKKNNDPPIPKFAHICTSVRKKEERKQLMGFECKQCEHYCQSRLDFLSCISDWNPTQHWLEMTMATIRVRYILLSQTQGKTSWLQWDSIF